MAGSRLRAMDEEEPLKGFRRRWQKRQRIDEDLGEAIECESFPGLSIDSDAEIQSAISGLLSEADPDQSERVRVDNLHGVSTAMDDSASLSSAFITGNKGHSLKMPWESESVAGIFGDFLPSVSLSMPSSWSASVSFKDQAADHVETKPAGRVPQGDLLQCVRNKVDRPFLSSQKVDMASAIAKLTFFLSLNVDASRVGQQLAADVEERELILGGIMGTKSPSTVIKRANALLAFYRWHATMFDEHCIPFQEKAVWTYIKHLLSTGAAPTRAMSFIQALRFARFILQVDGAQECLDSRRIVGQAELMLSKKPPTRQARPLTVREVIRLHEIALAPEEPLVNRVAATHFLLLISGRSRNSDLVHIQEVLHDSNIKSDIGRRLGPSQERSRSCRFRPD